MKKIVVLSVISVLAILTIISVGRTSYKSYYSGDAVNYEGNLVVASTDTGSLEIFKLNGSVLEKASKFKAPNSPLDKTEDFSAVKLNIESGHLFAYATSAYTLYKYDISDLSRPVLFDKQKNTYWEWYNRVDIFGGKIVTISDKSIKVWNGNFNMLDVVDSYKIDNDLASAVNFDASGKYIITINKDDKVRIFDVASRSYISEFPLNYRDDTGLRKTYFDSVTKELYVFDDYYLKRFNIYGTLLASYPNSSNQGYSVEPAGNPNFIYVANGNSIMKLDRANFKGLKISAESLSAGAWAMDLKYVNTQSGDKLVVFNGTNIAVLNSSLKKISSVKMTDNEEILTSRENLSLYFSNNKGTAGANVSLQGTGFQNNEDLTINFGGTVTKSKADRNGRFTQTLIVPTVSRDVIDVKVDGDTSKLTYSTNFIFKK